jgi:delta 1-pyrroline-5-carboxylate dehydrogenase
MTFFAEPEWSGRGYIGGWSVLEATAPVVSPSSGETLGAVGLGGAGDIAVAVERARTVQPDWAARPAPERAAVMRRAAVVVEAERETLERWLIDEAGSARGKAGFEVGLVLDELHHAAATAMMPYGQLLRTSRPRLSLVRHRPVGVVGVIAPFNFPAILASRSVFPALALGNAVVLKPDPRTAISGGLALAAVLEQAGLPAGLFAVVPGGAVAGGALRNGRSSRSAGRWTAGRIRRTSSCSTSRLSRCTAPRSRCCSRPSAASRRRVPACCSSRTASTRCWGSPTGSRCCETAERLPTSRSRASTTAGWSS